MPTVDITVRESSLEEMLEVHNTVHEFVSEKNTKYFADRLAGHERLVLVASIGKKPVGYLIGYDRAKDGSFYCWMAGVNPRHRRMGVLKSLMRRQEVWAKERGYNSIVVKTLNDRREMLANLVVSDYNVINLEKVGSVREYPVYFQKKI